MHLRPATETPEDSGCRQAAKAVGGMKRRSRWAEATCAPAEATASLHRRLVCISLQSEATESLQPTQASSQQTGGIASPQRRNPAPQEGSGKSSLFQRAIRFPPGADVEERIEIWRQNSAVGHALKSPGNPAPLKLRGRPRAQKSQESRPAKTPRSATR